jgi:hypothetical protein
MSALSAYTDRMAAVKPRKSHAQTGGPIPPVVRVRGLKRLPEIQLFVRAGGYCEFPGCNRYLLEHRPTLTLGNFAQIAHIVAFSPQGPRANAKMPSRYINDLTNLMLLCPSCHKVVDDNPDEYPVRRLRHLKAEHENRIRHLTGLHRDLETTVVRFTARIAGRAPAISFEQITAAVDPRYPVDRNGLVIDLCHMETTGEQLIKVGQDEIRTKIGQLGTSGLDGNAVDHLSVFALAPIPLLVFLGRSISDKQSVDFFQRHRDTDDWKWKSAGPDVEYAFRRIQMGSVPGRVALCLSLSGSIERLSLPTAIDDTFFVYELTLAAGQPSPLFLRKKADLDNFRRAYMIALREIMAAHRELTQLHLFPAVPAPVAIVCGHALLPKVDPTILVYDADKTNGGFTFSTSVN